MLKVNRKNVAIVSKAAYYSMFKLWKIYGSKLDSQNWLWRREKIPIDYHNMQWGNAFITLKQNKIAITLMRFYDRIKVFVNF